MIRYYLFYPAIKGKIRSICFISVIRDSIKIKNHTLYTTNSSAHLSRSWLYFVQVPFLW